MSFYGDKIEILEKELERLKEKERKDKEASFQMTKEIRVAEFLHEKLCNWNHTDGCGFFYEKWDKPEHSKKEYLKKAINLLSSFTEADIYIFFKKLNER